MTTKARDTFTLVSDCDVKRGDPYVGMIAFSNSTGDMEFIPKSPRLMDPELVNKRSRNIDARPYGEMMTLVHHAHPDESVSTYIDLVKNPQLTPRVWDGATWPTFACRAHQAEVEPEHFWWGGPQWLGPVVTRLREVIHLPANWDSYGAAEPSVDHAVDALQFLRRVMLPAAPPPAIVPLNDGGIQLEWHEGGLDFEATFSSGADRGFFLHDRASGDETEGAIEEGIEGLRGLLGRF